MVRWQLLGEGLELQEHRVPLLQLKASRVSSPPVDHGNVRASVRVFDEEAFEGWRKSRGVAIPLSRRGPFSADAEAPIVTPDTWESLEVQSWPLWFEVSTRPVIRGSFQPESLDEGDAGDEVQLASRLHLRWRESYLRASVVEIQPTNQKLVSSGELRLHSYFLDDPNLSALFVWRGWQQQIPTGGAASYQSRFRLQHRYRLSSRWQSQLSAEMGMWRSTLNRQQGIGFSEDVHSSVFSEYRQQHQEWLQVVAKLRRRHFQDLYSELFVVGRSNDDYLLHEPDRVSYGYRLRGLHNRWHSGVEIRNIQRFRDGDRLHRDQEFRVAMRLGTDRWLGPARLLSFAATAEHSITRGDSIISVGIAFRFGARQGEGARLIDPELIPFRGDLDARYPWSAP